VFIFLKSTIDLTYPINLLFLVVKEFNKLDLHPEKVSNQEMGYIFEELIRRFSENAEAGDHYTPREVIELMVNIIFNGEEDELTNPGNISTIGDFACGTGGMLSVAENYIHEMNPNAEVALYGQEINDQSYAICKADMLIKGEGENADNIALGNSLTTRKRRLFELSLVISLSKSKFSIISLILALKPLI